MSDFDGRPFELDWVIAAYADGRNACTRWIIGADRGGDAGSCHTVTAVDGLPDFGLSEGSPTVIEGLFDDIVVDIEVQLIDATVRPPLVPLDTLGWSGRGFAMVVPAGHFVQAIGYDQRGREVRRVVSHR